MLAYSKMRSYLNQKIVFKYANKNQCLGIHQNNKRLRYKIILHKSDSQDRLDILPCLINGQLIKLNNIEMFQAVEHLNQVIKLNGFVEQFSVIVKNQYLIIVQRMKGSITIEKEDQDSQQVDTQSSFSDDILNETRTFLEYFHERLQEFLSYTGKYRSMFRKRTKKAVKSQVNLKKSIYNILGENQGNSTKIDDKQRQLKEFDTDWEIYEKKSKSFQNKTLLSQLPEDKNCLTSNFYYLSSIELKEEHDSMEYQKINGGVSSVQALLAQKIKFCNQKQQGEIFQQKNKKLAKKTMVQKLNMQQIKKAKLKSRFTRQPRAIKAINLRGGHKPYLLNYYFPRDTDQYYYLDYLDMNLAEYLQWQKSSLTYEKLLDICIQITKIVIDLHSLGIIHRDIKPSNFMVEMRKQDNWPIVKIIDFSDCFIENQDTVQECIQILMATIPFSPIECYYRNKRYSKEGISQTMIDYWSVGIIIYYVMFGQSPISYSSVFHKDINQLWQNQFLMTYSAKSSQGLSLIKNIIDLLKIGLVRPKQNQRINLHKCLQILQKVKFYLSTTKLTL